MARYVSLPWCTLQVFLPQTDFYNWCEQERWTHYLYCRHCRHPCTWVQGILQGQLGNQAHTSHDISLLRKFGGCFIPCLCQYSGSLFSLKFGVEINVMKKISKICIRALTKFSFVIGICWGWIALTSSRLISIKSIRQMSSFHDCCLKNKIIHSQKSLNLHIIVTLSLGV